MNFIVDKEINLKSNSGRGSDALNTVIYADRLMDCIEKAPMGRCFTIGLFGEWGCGKSSVIKTVEESYTEKAKKESKNVKVVNYDAWKYSGDSFRRMFLLELQQQLGIKRSDKMQRFYDNINEDVEVKHVWNNNYIYLIIVILFVLCMLFLFGSDVKAEWKLSLATFATMVSLLMNIKRNSLDDLKIILQKSRLFAPEQFEDCFDDLLQSAYRPHNTTEKIYSWIRKEGFNIDLDQLVVVIDNIDRCQSEIAYKLLTDIKNFLGKNFNLVFVVPVDVDALRKHILSSSTLSKDELNRDADEFLRKFFNVSIWMKPFRTDEIFEFASKLNNDNQLNFNDTTLNLVSKQFATNPRRIIQLFNNLSVELQGYEETIRTEDQSLIAKIQILKEEFPDFYQLSLSEPRLLFKDYKSIVSEYGKSQPDEVLVNNNNRLQFFLSNTLAVTIPYKEKENLLSKILSNAVTFDGLPLGLTDAIDINDYPSIKAFDGLDKYKPQLIKYLNMQLQKSIQRGLYMTDVLTYLDTYLQLFSDNLLSSYQKKELMNIIGDSKSLRAIIDNSPKLDLLIKLGKDVEQQSLNALSQTIIESLKFPDNTQIMRLTEKIRSGILLGCSIWNKGQVRQLTKEFAVAYSEDPVAAQKYDYNNKYSILISDELIEEEISQIELDTIANDNSAYQSVRYFSDYKVFSESMFNKFISKMNELTIHYEWKNNNANALIPYIQQIYPVIGNCMKCTPLKDSSHLIRFWEILSGKTNVPGKGVKSIILDNLANQELIALIAELFFVMTNISRKVVIPQDELEEMMEWNQNQIVVLRKLHDLYQNGFDTSYYSRAICRSKIFDRDHLDMIEKLFRCDDDNLVSSELKTSELNLLLETIIDGQHENCRSIVRMIDDITSEPLMENIFDIVLRERSIDDLAKLSPKIQRFAIARFVEDVDSYKNNEVVLTSIATFGKPTEISSIIPVINTKLVNYSTLPSSDLEMIARVILCLNSLKKSEVEQVSANLLSVSNDKLSKDKINECVNYISSLIKRKKTS